MASRITPSIAFRQVPPPPLHNSADPSRVKQPIEFEDEPRMNTNRYEYRWTSFAATTSRNAAHPGARASRPHKSWHSLGHLLHPGRPATAPGLRFGRSPAVPAGRVAGCPIAGKPSAAQRQCMRAGRPRSRVGLFPSLLLLEGARAGCRAAVPPMRQSRPASWPFVVLRVSSWMSFLRWGADNPSLGFGSELHLLRSPA